MVEVEMTRVKRSEHEAGCDGSEEIRMKSMDEVECDHNEEIRLETIGELACDRSVRSNG